MPSVKKSYKHPDGYYADRFNISTSSVFRYKKEGAPLDNDQKFFAWMSQRGHKPKSMRMPGGTRAHRVSGIRKRVMADAPEVADGVSAEHQGEADEAERAIIKGGGLRVEIARQEAECEQAYKNYRAAEKAQDPLAAVSYHKIWTSAQEMLRKLCKDVPKSEQDDAKVLPVGDVEGAWMTALKELKTTLENIPAAVALGLTGVDPEVRVQVEQKMMDEITLTIANLRETPWLK